MEGTIREYLVYNSKQYYYSAYGQELLGDPELTQLNEKGKKFYSEVLEKVKQDHFKVMFVSLGEKMVVQVI